MSQVANIPTTSSPSSPSRKKYRAPQRPTVQELRHKYENQPSISPKTPKPKAPKKMHKSKVKQMARVFNCKISQFFRRVKKCICLSNQRSPELEPEPQATLPTPTPLSNTQLTKVKAPAQPCPCSKQKVKTEEETTCCVAEELFAKLTVKEKALLYTQFIEDTFRKNPKLGKSGRLLETDIKCDETCSEVINETKESVKSLWNELENPCKTPSNASTPISLGKNGSIKKLENMFYTWLKERQEHEVSKQDASNFSEIDEEKQKSDIERLLEEAIAKLETIENSQEEETSTSESPMEVKTKEDPNALHGNDNINDGNPKIQSHKKKPATSSESSTTCSAISSGKQSEAEESESGVYSLTKTTSEESQSETQKEILANHENLLETQSQSLKSLRKKKMRRTLSWRKDITLVEIYPPSTSDSDLDLKKNKINRSTQVEPSFIELNQSLMTVVNSRRKIKPAYNNEHCRQGLAQSNQEIDVSYVGKPKTADLQPEQHFPVDSFDQGFEADANKVHCPIEQTQKLSLKGQDIKTMLPISNKMGSNSPKVSIEPKLKPEKPLRFSLPIKEQNSSSFNFGHSDAQQQIFNPTSTPYKNRRRSIYNNDPRRSSITMQVIPEGKPLENHNIQSAAYMTDNTGAFFANAPTLMNMSSNEIDLNAEKTSSFWIKSGDFAISLEIFHCSPGRVKSLHQILSQSSGGTKNTYFGIDSHKFSAYKDQDHFSISTRLSPNKECSHYWLSAGEMTIPFSGKILSPEKIQRLFQFIRASVEETGILRFGVDDVEFSNVPESWTESPKFSLESNYSMLVGLQSGSSNGLEGRSKYAWPHSKRVSVGDLDNSEYGDCINSESRRALLSPFSSNYYDLACLGADDLMTPRNSETMKSAETFYQNFENEPLDQLFSTRASSQQQKSVPTVTEVSKMLEIIEQQKQRLSSVQEQLAGYNKYSGLSEDTLGALKGTPEYLAQLKSIVTDISQIGCKDGFSNCSVEQLERYKLLLRSYADACLTTCDSHLGSLLEALKDHRAVVV